MHIYPAIDILDGRAVRLLKGERSAVTVYYDDPIEAARKMRDCGAGYLHIVDLNGAFDGEQKALKTVEKIAALGSFYIELGGGIRDRAAAERAYNCGADRIILGTAALTGLAKELDAARVAVGIDAKDGIAATKGWTDSSGVAAIELAERTLQGGIFDIIYTDIAKDGAMSGVNIKELSKMTALENARITASGGISKMEDLFECERAGAYAAIIGRAFYEGALDLAAAVETFEK